MAIEIIERFGGHGRVVTLLTAILHFLHALFCLINYLSWVRHVDILSHVIRSAYIGLCVVGCVSYLFGASVFYMWAWRFPEPEEVAKRRRVYGIMINLLLSDVPLFVIETQIVWEVQFRHGIQGFTYVLTCISIFYSILRVWTFFMVRVIKFRLPQRENARYSLSRPFRRTDHSHHANNNNSTIRTFYNRNKENEGGNELEPIDDENNSENSSNNNNNGEARQRTGLEAFMDDVEDFSPRENDNNNNNNYYGAAVNRYIDDSDTEPMAEADDDEAFYTNNNNNENVVGIGRGGGGVISVNHNNDSRNNPNGPFSYSRREAPGGGILKN
ncbi:hypothetical protein ADEAN_000437000 [Angomonas deanei]|uniref:Uncharacterized protein n=1 Tax=Angomonas deanei TaxID=59799 RepID=A0A7G2CFH1_9TRYP|nr:hypothetical protein ADEAN_000437000 [Angomonas deanei]